MKKFISVFLITVIVFSQALFADTVDTKPRPYEKDEFPGFAHDLRRAEIITFGSLPFVTLGVTMGYGAYGYFTGKYSSFPNPLDKSTDSFSQWEQVKIFGTALGISAGLGIVDYTVTVIKRHNKKKRQKKLEEKIKHIQIIPYSVEYIRLMEMNQLLQGEVE